MCRRLGFGFGVCVKEGTTLKTLKSTIFHFNTNISRSCRVIKLSQLRQPEKRGAPVGTLRATYENVDKAQYDLMFQ